MCLLLFFFFKQKTAYDMRISDWSSDVCASDLWSWKCNCLDRLSRRCSRVTLFTGLRPLWTTSFRISIKCFANGSAFRVFRASSYQPSNPSAPFITAWREKVTLRDAETNALKKQDPSKLRCLDSRSFPRKYSVSRTLFSTKPKESRIATL